MIKVPIHYPKTKPFRFIISSTIHDWLRLYSSTYPNIVKVSFWLVLPFTHHISLSKTLFEDVCKSNESPVLNTAINPTSFGIEFLKKIKPTEINKNEGTNYKKACTRPTNFWLGLWFTTSPPIPSFFVSSDRPNWQQQ